MKMWHKLHHSVCMCARAHLCVCVRVRVCTILLEGGSRDLTWGKIGCNVS